MHTGASSRLDPRPLCDLNFTFSIREILNKQPKESLHKIGLFAVTDSCNAEALSLDPDWLRPEQT